MKYIWLFLTVATVTGCLARNYTKGDTNSSSISNETRSGQQRRTSFWDDSGSGGSNEENNNLFSPDPTYLWPGHIPDSDDIWGPGGTREASPQSDIQKAAYRQRVKHWDNSGDDSSASDSGRNFNWDNRVTRGKLRHRFNSFDSSKKSGSNLTAVAGILLDRGSTIKPGPVGPDGMEGLAGTNGRGAIGKVRASPGAPGSWSSQRKKSKRNWGFNELPVNTPLPHEYDESAEKSESIEGLGVGSGLTGKTLLPRGGGGSGGHFSSGNGYYLLRG